MSGHRIKTYCRHLQHALIVGVCSSAFGWGAVAGAAILGFWGPVKMCGQIPEWLQQPIASTAFAMLFVFVIHLIVIAPWRAFFMLRPFSVKVAAGFIETQYPMGRFEPQKVALVVTNRSYRPRSNCVLHIMSANGCEENYFPRFIEEFSLPSGDTKPITFMAWTSRRPPYENDKTITLVGPIGSGFGGNIVTLPCGSYDVVLRIGIPEGDPIVILSRVWIEGDFLKAVRI